MLVSVETLLTSPCSVVGRARLRQHRAGRLPLLRRVRDQVEEVGVDALEAGGLRVGDVARDVLKREGLGTQPGNCGGKSAIDAHVRLRNPVLGVPTRRFAGNECKRDAKSAMPLIFLDFRIDIALPAPADRQESPGQAAVLAGPLVPNPRHRLNAVACANGAGNAMLFDTPDRLRRCAAPRGDGVRHGRRRQDAAGGAAAAEPLVPLLGRLPHRHAPHGRVHRRQLQGRGHEGAVPARPAALGLDQDRVQHHLRQSRSALDLSRPAGQCAQGRAAAAPNTSAGRSSTASPRSRRCRRCRASSSAPTSSMATTTSSPTPAAR